MRFAKDKRPYNRHLSAILSPDGTKMEQGVFYVHIGLEGCFAGVAWWQPEAALLLAMRRAIATQPDRFRAMVKALKKNGLELDGEGRMKRTPRGFEHVTDADLVAAIRNRHFVVRARDRSGWNPWAGTGRRTRRFHLAGQAAARLGQGDRGQNRWRAKPHSTARRDDHFR